jgi:CMP-N-acetylneuraminic acid synthetase
MCLNSYEKLTLMNLPLWTELTHLQKLTKTFTSKSKPYLNKHWILVENKILIKSKQVLGYS